eukprot:c6274_g2_i1.p3 GENE.c6274_g2_i1~~c6274_g2_i1.p3  ORF type:complete len:112 (-),score=28.31 c6274_g2_i1:581-916(-)
MIDWKLQNGIGFCFDLIFLAEDHFPSITLPFERTFIRTHHITLHHISSHHISDLKLSSQVRGCDISRDGGRVISCSEDRTIRVWDVTTSEQLWVLEGHSDKVLHKRVCDAI